MSQYWVSYILPFGGLECRAALNEDDEWRLSLLGKNHWTGKSYGANDVRISVVTTNEIAVVMSLKHKTEVRKYVAQTQ